MPCVPVWPCERPLQNCGSSEAGGTLRQRHVVLPSEGGVLSSFTASATAAPGPLSGARLEIVSLSGSVPTYTLYQ